MRAHNNSVDYAYTVHMLIDKKSRMNRQRAEIQVAEAADVESYKQR